MKVIVMSGMSGSGKSTHAAKLMSEHIGSKVVVSADQYFMVGDEYKFDPAGLSRAHSTCLYRFIEALQRGTDLVIVDNTNLTSEELAPYMLGAQAFGYEAEIITLKASMAMCTERNVHGVTLRGVENQWVKLNSRVLLPWWKNTDIVVPDPEAVSHNHFGESLHLDTCPACAKAYGEG